MFSLEHFVALFEINKNFKKIVEFMRMYNLTTKRKFLNSGETLSIELLIILFTTVIKLFFTNQIAVRYQI